MIRFSKGFGKDNTCKDKPLHGGIGTMCVFVCVCVFGGGRRRWWWGRYTSPGEHVMLLSRPQTPSQSTESTEKMKADASLLPFLSRLFLLCTELFLCAC